MDIAAARSQASGKQDAGNPTLATETLRRLREDILSCRFHPGQKLRLEELKSVYGVGFSPLREALMHLTSDRLVIAEGRRGFKVAPVSAEDLRDVTQTRQQIEAIALRDSISSGGDEWEAGILAAFHLLRRAQRFDPQTGLLDPDWTQKHQAFHYSLVAAASSQWIKHFWNITFEQSDRYRRLSLSLSGHHRNDDAEHQQLIDAVLSRDSDRACELSRDHIQRTADIVLNNLRPGP